MCWLSSEQLAQSIFKCMQKQMAWVIEPCHGNGYNIDLAKACSATTGSGLFRLAAQLSTFTFVVVAAVFFFSLLLFLLFAMRQHNINLEEHDRTCCGLVWEFPFFVNICGSLQPECLSRENVLQKNNTRNWRSLACLLSNLFVIEICYCFACLFFDIWI